MTSTKVKTPAPTQSEQNLQAEQAEMLRQQRDILSQQLREQQLIAPMLFGQAGLTPTFSEKGELTSLTEDPTQKEIRQGIAGRTLAALKGELPIDPILNRELGAQETTLRESLRKQLGPGFETSTAGIEALQKAREGRAGILHSASKGELTMGEALGLTRQQASQEALMRALAPQRGLAEAFGGAATGFQQAMQPFFAQRQMQQQGRIATTGFRQKQLGTYLSMVNSLLGGAGQGAGSAAGAAAFSSMKLKDAIAPLDKDEYGKALKKVRETPIVRYKYKWEGEEGRAPHIGPLLEMSPAEIKEDSLRVNVMDYTGLVHAGLKGLDREVQTLRSMMERKRGG